MATQVSDRLATVELKPLVGTRVLASGEELLSGNHAAQIRSLLDERVALVFPGVHLNAEEQIAFTRTLGSRNEDLSKEIWKVSADASVNPNKKMASYQRSSFMWHMDAIYTSTPDLATTLSAQTLSPTAGGQTQIANMYAAFADLPEQEKAYLEKLRVVHSFETHMRTVEPWPSYGELQNWQSQASVTRDLVWTHASGRKSLVLGAHASHIEDMNPAEGRALLCKLHEWATQPQYVYTHEWSLGDLLIFNNSGSLHRAVEYPLDSGRLMHRTSIRGEERFD